MAVLKDCLFLKDNAMEKRKNSILFWITLFVCLLPILFGLVFWKQLPDTMASHFNFSNEADGYMSKPALIFGLFGFLAFMQIFIAWIFKGEKQTNGIPKSVKTLCLWIVPCISIFCGVVCYGYALDFRLNVVFAGGLLLGMMYLVFGLEMRKCKPNPWFGFRFSWTINSMQVWDKTHALASKLWIAAGILFIALDVLGQLNIFWLLVLSAGIVLVPCIYSYFLYKKVS
jgi:uncharacterized membrane protein